MITLATWQASETRLIAVTTTDKKESFGALCTGVVLSADADCFVAFDENADTGSLLIKGATAAQAVFFPVKFTEIHAITSAGTANLYVLALR